MSDKEKTLRKIEKSKKINPKDFDFSKYIVPKTVMIDLAKKKHGGEQ